MNGTLRTILFLCPVNHGLLDACSGKLFIIHYYHSTHPMTLPWDGKLCLNCLHLRRYEVIHFYGKALNPIGTHKQCRSCHLIASPLLPPFHRFGVFFLFLLLFSPLPPPFVYNHRRVHTVQGSGFHRITPFQLDTKVSFSISGPYILESDWVHLPAHHRN